MSNDKLAQALRMVLDDPNALDGRPRTYKFVMEALAAHEAEKQAPTLDNLMQRLGNFPTPEVSGEVVEEQAGPVARAHVRSVTPGRIDELDVLRPLPQGTHLLYAAPVQASAVGAEPVRYPHPDEDDPVTLWKEIRRLRAAMSQAGPVAVQAPAPAHAADHGTGYARVRIDTAPRDGMAFVTPESADKPGEWNDGAQFFGVLASPAPAGAQGPAPPSPLTEQDKDDAELCFAEAFRATWKQQIGGTGNTAGRDVALRVAVDAIRAARAKKEQQ